MSAPRRMPHLFAVALAAVLVLAGCATGGGAPRPAEGVRLGTVALLPLENLSGHAEYGERFSRLVWATLARTGRWDVVDPGQTDAILADLRIRSAGALTTAQVLETSARLHVRWILAGTLLECGMVRTPDGDVPTFGLALRLLDGRTGQVVWTDLRTRSGQDRETIFGWGREEDLDRLAEATARDLVERMRTPGRSDGTPESTTDSTSGHTPGLTPEREGKP